MEKNLNIHRKTVNLVLEKMKKNKYSQPLKPINKLKLINTRNNSLPGKFPDINKTSGILSPALMATQTNSSIQRLINRALPTLVTKIENSSFVKPILLKNSLNTSNISNPTLKKKKNALNGKHFFNKKITESVSVQTINLELFSYAIRPTLKTEFSTSIDKSSTNQKFYL